jgi:ferrous iron transport protein A
MPPMTTQTADTTLDRVPIGASARIRRIVGDRSLIRRLLGLGLRVGSEVRIMQRRGRGVVIVSAGNRIALGSSVADKLQISLLKEEL